jgi:hypothetical protein
MHEESETISSKHYILSLAVLLCWCTEKIWSAVVQGTSAIDTIEQVVRLFKGTGSLYDTCAKKHAFSIFLCM